MKPHSPPLAETRTFALPYFEVVSQSDRLQPASSGQRIDEYFIQDLHVIRAHFHFEGQHGVNKVMNGSVVTASEETDKIEKGFKLIKYNRSSEIVDFVALF